MTPQDILDLKDILSNLEIEVNNLGEEEASINRELYWKTLEIIVIKKILQKNSKS